MDIKDVESLVELAKIELTPEEKKDILKDMDGILGYVRQIQEVEVGEVSPKYDLKNVWREDKSADYGSSRESILNQFPESQDGFLKVKKIL